MRHFVVPALLALSLTAPTALLAADTSPRTISVAADGEVKVIPDMATVQVGVLVEGAETGPVMDQASAATAAVLAKLAELGIAETDIQSGTVRLTPRYGSTVLGGTDFSKIEGYTAQNEIIVKVRDLNALGGLLSAVIGQGANTLQGVTFGLQEPDEAMDAARRAAVAEAMRRAALYAEAAGVDLGPLLSLTENGYSGVPMYRMEAAPMGASSAPSYDVPVAPGEMSVTASVGMTYEIED